jgi:hypothetical protein
VGDLRPRDLRGVVRHRPPRHRTDGKTASCRGPDHTGRPIAIERLFTVLRIDLVYMYAIVFATVVKPTTDDGWTIAIVAALLVVLTLVFLAPLRSSSAQPPSAAATD